MAPGRIILSRLTTMGMYTMLHMRAERLLRTDYHPSDVFCITWS